jgi:hypothetical protein
LISGIHSDILLFFRFIISKSWGLYFIFNIEKIKSFNITIFWQVVIILDDQEYSKQSMNRISLCLIGNYKSIIYCIYLNFLDLKQIFDLVIVLITYF